MKSYLELYIPSLAKHIGKIEISDENGVLVPLRLDTKDRKKIVRSVSMWANANYSKNISSHEFKVVLAEMITELFPIFKTLEAPFFGADSFYNPDTRTGFLCNTLRYRGRNEALEPHRKKSKSVPCTISKVASENIEELKILSIPEDREKILLLLKATLKERRYLMKDNPDVYTDFPFYFNDCDIVSFKFYFIF